MLKLLVGNYIIEKAWLIPTSFGGFKWPFVLHLLRSDHWHHLQRLLPNLMRLYKIRLGCVSNGDGSLQALDSDRLSVSLDGTGNLGNGNLGHLVSLA